MLYPDIPIKLNVEIIETRRCIHYISSDKEKSSHKKINTNCYFPYSLTKDLTAQPPSLLAKGEKENAKSLSLREKLNNSKSLLLRKQLNNSKPLSSQERGLERGSPNTIANQLKSTKNVFTILPIGINLGTRNVNESILIRGFEDRSQAVDFDNWLLPFDDVLSALKITKTTLDDGKLELRSPGLVKRINPKDLKTDAELGLVISVAYIKNILGVPTEFDIVKYAIVFNPPWLGLSTKKGSRQAELPVILDGLPQVDSPAFSFSTIGQSINISGTGNNTNAQGNLTAIGTMLGGSWYIRTNQPTLIDRQTWNINEAQYLRQTPTSDYVVGSHPTFWRNQGGQFWGVTTVQRFGYTPPETVGDGFSPSQRMRSNQIGRTI
ncbi:MAG: carboxypeptidase regulatory-like domain-containing protein, partial [Richelia sp. RM2_1_2]|nr:carboxypeptidase regulatory-like domain-containing protein [Richelia sp. RM2_1_2]